MHVIKVRNVNQAWDESRKLMSREYVLRPSRNGDVMEHPQPVTTQYLNPTERVLFNPERNANPFLHLMEALYLLAGRNDVAFLAQFTPKIAQYSDDGKIFHGAYGFRLRYAFDLDGGAEDGYADQLPKVVEMLKKSPDERRCVLGIWNPLWDLDRPDVRDVPCNIAVMVKIREGKLCITVCNRSNDIVLGAMGVNVVQFSMLQEYLAAMVGVPVGTYWQVSDSWHAYVDNYEKLGGLSSEPTLDYYSFPQHHALRVEPYPMVRDPESWDDDLKRFFETSRHGNLIYINPFFSNVVIPMFNAWHFYKQDDFKTAYWCLYQCLAKDWQRACVEWLQRIEAKRAAKANIGVSK